MTINPNRLFTLAEVATILRVSRQTLYNNIRSGKLQAAKIGREYRITGTQLQEIVDYGFKGKPKE